MKIRCLAVDDEPMGLRQLTRYLSKVPFFDVVGSCASAIEASQLMETTPVDVLFIDISMPDLNGLDFVRSLQKPPMVVFTTAYSEYAIDGYEVEAVDYLLKPFGMGKLMAAANKVKARFELLHAATAATPAAEDSLFIKTEHRMVRIQVSQISHIEAMAEYLRVHLADSAKPIVTLLSMKMMEERLASHGFLRIHRSYIVNPRCIVEVNKATLTLAGGARLPIGDSYRDAVGRYVAEKSLVK